MNKYIYLGDNKIAGPVEHEKPKPIEYTEGDSIYPDDSDVSWLQFQRDLKKWKSYIASLPKIEVVKEPTHSWEINQIIEKDIDFVIAESYLKEGKIIEAISIKLK